MITGAAARPAEKSLYVLPTGSVNAGCGGLISHESERRRRLRLGVVVFVFSVARPIYAAGRDLPEYLAMTCFLGDSRANGVRARRLG